VPPGPGRAGLFAVDDHPSVAAAFAVEPLAGERGAGCWRVVAGVRGAVLAGAPCGWLFAVVLGAERLHRGLGAEGCHWAGCVSRLRGRVATLPLGYLRELGVVPSPPAVVADGPVEEVLEGYRRYMLSERGVKERTVAGYEQRGPPTADPRLGGHSRARPTITDVSAWMSLRVGWAERLIAYLDAVAEGVPEQMDVWTHRVVDAMTDALGNNYEAHAGLLLFVALNPFVEPLRMSDHGLQTSIASLRRIPYFRYFRPREDLLVSAVATLLSPLGDDRQAQAAVFKRVTDRVSPQDKELLVANFVR
jgi:hypothetical protein